MINIPSGFVQATINWSGPTKSGEASTVLGFAWPPAMDLLDVAVTISGAVETNLTPVQHQEFALTGISVLTETQRLDLPVGPFQGNRTGDLAPPQVCVLMSKSSLARGRHARGRNYWPGFLNDGDVYNDGTINPSWVGTLNQAFVGFGEDVSTAGLNLVLLHNDPGLAPTAVISAVIEGKVATQRRRLR